MAKYVAAVDQGTTSTRFMIFDHAGKVVGVDQKEHEQIYPKPGWVEHDPMEIWERTQDVIAGALAKANLTAEDHRRGRRHQPARDHRGLGQEPPASRSTTPSSGRIPAPTRSATNWPRTAGRIASARKVGLPLATYFSGPKIKWILDNVPGARAKAEKGEVLFGNIDTWVIWNLTGGPNGGVHVTDVSNATRTMLMNLETLDWDPEILKIMGIPRAMLPAIDAVAAQSTARRSAR